ncbi:MAG: hypothetical protein K0R62_2580 [Nonomuraea muscovyensis]|nr:hypothetical protein [Nonomuraea muscovyensis]
MGRLAGATIAHMPFPARWAMVGLMTGYGQAQRAPGRCFAFAGVLGLVLLCLLLAGSAPTPYGGTAQRAAVAGDAWMPGAWDSHLSSTLPQTASSAREHHVLSLWPGSRREPAGHVPPRPVRGNAPDGLRDPQQFGHRTAGSRSPPLI